MAICFFTKNQEGQLPSSDKQDQTRAGAARNDSGRPTSHQSSSPITNIVIPNELFLLW